MSKNWWAWSWCMCCHAFSISLGKYNNKWPNSPTSPMQSLYKFISNFTFMTKLAWFKACEKDFSVQLCHCIHANKYKVNQKTKNVYIAHAQFYLALACHSNWSWLSDYIPNWIQFQSQVMQACRWHDLQNHTQTTIGHENSPKLY